MLGGCFAVPDYDDTRFKCDVEPVCPEDFVCFEGVCRDDVAPPGMVLFPAGTSMMGCIQGADDCNMDARPLHPISLSEFAIDVHEVTEAQYQACVDAGSCVPVASGGTSTALPVRGVTWNAARAYCAHVGKKLPTEAQWEFAARAGGGQVFPWGGAFDCTVVNAAPCALGTVVDVESMPGGATADGLMHMAGNVREWVLDSYDETFYLQSGSSLDPSNVNNSVLKVVRGGSFRSSSALLTVWFRDFVNQSSADDDLGIRCAK
ncbi:MAG TPA: formylglycine-generating enzyme family protein [Kofleriaceae bacterium]